MLKKSLALLSLLALIPFLASAAEPECPFGLTEDAPPGDCARYVDKDGNANCDLADATAKAGEQGGVAEHECTGEHKTSEQVLAGRSSLSGTEMKALTVREVAESAGVECLDYAAALSNELEQAVSPDDRMQDLHDRYELGMSKAKDILSALSAAKTDLSADDESKSVASAKAVAPVQEESSRQSYDIIWPVLLLSSLYALTSVLVRLKRLPLLWHRRLWNTLLLFAFLACALTGVLLALRFNYGWPALGWYSLRLHVGTGIAMTLISVFHIAWHWRYYACMFQRAKKQECEVKTDNIPNISQ